MAQGQDGFCPNGWMWAGDEPAVSGTELLVSRSLVLQAIAKTTGYVSMASHCQQSGTARECSTENVGAV